MNDAKWHDILRSVDIKPGDLVVDVGAHAGDTVQIWVDKGAVVYAFEPHPKTFKALRSRFSGVSGVTCVNAALWDRDGMATLYPNADAGHTNGSSLYAGKNNVAKDKGIGVATRGAAAFIRELVERHGRHVAFMKINAEGAEYAILYDIGKHGAADLVDKCYATTHARKIAGLRPDKSGPAYAKAVFFE